MQPRTHVEEIVPLVKDILSSYGVSSSTPIVVAASGGVDSSVLVSIVYRAGYGNVAIGHVTHGIRNDEEGARDKGVVEELSTATGYPAFFRSFAPDLIARDAKRAGESLEAVARNRRYDALRDVLEKWADGVQGVILTAHHRDDAVETFVMRMISGRSPLGAVTIPERSEIAGAVVLRPLLGVSREDLSRASVAYNIPWRNDPTNSDTHFLRNYVRSDLIAGMEQRYPRAKWSIADFSDDIAALRDAVIAMIPDEAWGHPVDDDGWRIPRGSFRVLPEAAAELILRHATQVVSRSNRLSLSALKPFITTHTGDRRPGNNPRITIGDVEITASDDHIELFRRVVRSTESGYLVEVSDGTFAKIELKADTASCCRGRAPQDALRFAAVEPPIVVRSIQRGDTLRKKEKYRRLTDLTAPGDTEHTMRPRSVVEDRYGIAVVFWSATQWLTRDGVACREFDGADIPSVSVQIQD